MKTLKKYLCYLLLVLATCIAYPFDSFADVGVLGSFAATGDMNSARSLHTSTVLPDGKVLITGGLVYSNNTQIALRKAEIYDPVTAQFTPTGDLNTGRIGHTATLMQNGKVLIAGGTQQWSAVPNFSSAEIYDPATGVFTYTGDLLTGRYEPTATLLPNGKVLIVGGTTYTSTLSSAELYDPNTGKFSATGSMPSSKGLASATLFDNGNVLISGGFTGNTPQASSYIYVTSTGNFITTGNMHTARAQHMATLLPNGKVLVTAGYGTGGSLSSSELYDPTTGSYNDTGHMLIPRDGHSATLLNDGNVLVTGGYDRSTNTMLAESEIYDVENGSFITAGNLLIPRSNHKTDKLSDGRILITGGGNFAGEVSSAEIYDPRPMLPPTAVAGGGQSVHQGQLVTLNGSGSYDPDANYPLTYSWAITSSPSGSLAQLSDTTSVNPTFTADMVGTYVVKLIVTDSFGVQSQPAYAVIKAYNSIPVADAGPDQSLTRIGSHISMDGSHSYDADGDVITYHWSFLSKPVNSLAVLTDVNTPTPSFTADANGEYVLQLTVSDSWSTSVADSVVVSFNNVAPVADAGMNQSVVMGDVVNLIGSNSSDANLDQLSYSWNIVSKPAGSMTTIINPTASHAVFTADKAGEYIVELIVNDGLINSLPDTCSVVAISFKDATTATIQEAIAIINSFGISAFNNKNMGSTLTNKLNAVLNNIAQGLYREAHDQLLYDILKKTDGCTTSGLPDKNDWIQNCSSQGQVYPLITKAINYLENM